MSTDRSYDQGGPPVDPAAAAVYWTARRRLRLATPQDEAAFSAWLEDPVNAAAFAAADDPVEALGDLASSPEIRAMREAALNKAPVLPPQRKVWMIGSGLTAAAAVAAGIVLAVSGDLTSHPLSNGSVGAPQGRPSPTSGQVTQRYASAVGERRGVTLDDGSVVELNTGSLIEVAYTDARRDIRLLRGQALFEVAHNARRPFVVTAGTQRITATGTAFDVRLDGEAVKVVLVEGHVTVTPVARRGLERLLPALGTQPLSPGEQLTATDDGAAQVSAADVTRATSWRGGQLIFRDDRLATAVAEMNRYTDNKLVIDDPRVAQLTISGTFGVAPGENFRAALTAYYPLEIQKRSDRVSVVAWRTAAATSGQ